MPLSDTPSTRLSPFCKAEPLTSPLTLALPEPDMADRPANIRAALRVLHAAAPEAAARVEGYIDDTEHRVTALSAEDPYRALVLDLHATMVRVDSGLLADVAKIELARLEHARVQAGRATAEAADRLDARGVWKAVLTPQVVVALLTLLLGSGGLGAVLMQRFGATP